MAAEKEVEDYLRSTVKTLKGQIRKVKWINRNGAPDDMIWVPGWRWPKMVEMKAPGKKLQPHQQREHNRLHRMGVETAKLDCKEDIDRFLKTR